MKNILDFTDFEYGVTVENSPGTKVEITIDSAEVTQSIKITPNQAYDLAQQLLSCLGEKTTEEFEELLYELEREKESIEEENGYLEGRIDYMRRTDRYIPF